MIQDVYEHLAYFYQIGVGSGCGKTFEFDIDKFCITYKFFPTKVDSALRILERSGYLHYEDDPDGKTRIMFLLGRNELYMLDQLPPTQEAVITALLRSYGSLFVDLTFIDEHLIARQAELNIQQVYFALKNLAARHIIKFIPRRKIPFISYTRDRVDGNKVQIPQEVWEGRREQYMKRIQSMLQYAKMMRYAAHASCSPILVNIMKRNASSVMFAWRRKRKRKKRNSAERLQKKKSS